MKILAQLSILAAVAAIATLNTACVAGGVALTSKSDVQQLAAASTATLAAPFSIKVTASDSENADIAADLEKQIAKSLAKARIPTAANGAPVTVTVTEVNRVSKTARFFAGNLAGKARCVTTVTLPNGETLRLEGKTRWLVGVPLGQALESTEDAVKFAASELTEQLAQRLRAPTLASR